MLGVDQPDPDLDNNVDDADLYVPAADIVVEKRVDQPVVYIGEQVTFTVNLWNYGPDASGAIVVDEALPPELTYVSSTASLGTYDPDTGVVDRCRACHPPICPGSGGTNRRRRRC